MPGKGIFSLCFAFFTAKKWEIGLKTDFNCRLYPFITNRPIPRFLCSGPTLSKKYGISVMSCNALTSDEIMLLCYDFIGRLNNFRGTMAPVSVEKDTPGFIFNRLGAPVGLYMTELYERGLAEPEAVDAKVKSIGALMGPYELMDFTGLDVNLHGNEYFAETLSPEFKPRSWMKKLVEEGNLGKKTGKGIYLSPEPGGEEIS